MLKIYLTIVLFLGLLISLLGFIIPFCISYPNDQLVVLGIIFIIGTPIIIFIGTKSVINQFKQFKK
jgi:hypothetical protein